MPGIGDEAAKAGIGSGQGSESEGKRVTSAAPVYKVAGGALRTVSRAAPAGNDNRGAPVVTEARSANERG